MTKDSKNLFAGKVFLFPTETVYGIGASIFDQLAIRRIYAIKGRDFSKALAAHISSISSVELLCDATPDLFYILAEHFFPGPLSIILPNVSRAVSKLVTAGMDTIAIRFPDSKIFSELADRVGAPLAGTSANISGDGAPTSFSQVNPYIIEQVDEAIDGGECKYKLESTVLSIVEKPKILRVGAIKVEAIEEVLNQKL